MPSSAEEWKDFATTGNAASVAEQLLQDQRLCRGKLMPSPLVNFLPSSSDSRFHDIAQHILPQSELPPSVRVLSCEGIVKGIKAYMKQASIDDDTPPRLASTVPTDDEFRSAAKVLHYLQKHGSVTDICGDSPLKDLLEAVDRYVSIGPSIRNEYHRRSFNNNTNASNEFRRCYMCRFSISTSSAHKLYPSLCESCALFNLRSSDLSLPENLQLRNKTALVTGGRANLGYHTALRLLRCGANVIVSSRYPRDAEARYAAEADFRLWAPRLKVVGADFRTARDAFRLVVIVRRLLQEWEPAHDASSSAGRLHILINNAAQTLTDPVASEVHAIAREERLALETGPETLLVDYGEPYVPEVRGGVKNAWISAIEDKTRLMIEDGVSADGHNNRQMVKKGLGSGKDHGAESSKTSWTQTIEEVPYEDMISAHSVNAFVPLILCRELLPHMGVVENAFLSEEMDIDEPSEVYKQQGASPERQSAANSNKKRPKSHSGKSSHPNPLPLGYIINVSSREGILEDRENSRSKAGHHVHTNMSKAAINMITETEASRAWKTRRVAMNSVDPGYMSAAPDAKAPAAHGGACPIGFEDGAARVLWPIAMGEGSKTSKERKAIWGRFLKHFGEVDAIVSRGM